MSEWSLFNTLKGLGPKLGGPLLMPFTSRQLAVDPMAKPFLPPESNKSLLNPAATGATFLKNFMGFEGTPQTRQQEEWMKNKLLQKTRESGSLDGVIDYKDYGSTQADQPSGDWTGGIFGAPFAYGNTLGKSGYSIPQQGGNVNWDKSGTSYDFDKGFIPDPIRSVFNNGGISNIVQDFIDGKGYGKGAPLHYSPDITITAKDIYDLFGGGNLMHKGEPTITPAEPTVQPPVQPTVQPPVQPTTPAYQPPVQPRVNNVSPGGGNSRRGPSYAQQAATVNRKAKSMGVKSPIRRTPGTKYGFGL